MHETLSLPDGSIAYEVRGSGPLVVLAHGMGDSRHSYRFVAPLLIAAGYRVANMDIRGCGDSSAPWPSYERADIAADIVALVRHLGGPAVVVGQSISGGAATIAATLAPELIVGLVELAPFTRRQNVDLGALLRNRRHRAGTLNLAKMLMLGSVDAWMSYLDLAIPAKPADWAAESARIREHLADPARLGVLRAMGKTTPADAGAQLPHVACPVLVIEGGADPDWGDPRAEGQRVVDELPSGRGTLVMIDGAGHYPHTETPDRVVELTLPFLAAAFAPTGGTTDA